MPLIHTAKWPSGHHILDVRLATHEARLLGHVGSSAIFVKTTLKKKQFETSLFMVCVIPN